MLKLKSILALCMLSTAVLGNAPISWDVPSGFNSDVAGLGLSKLAGITHDIIYNPQISKSNTDLGGNGVYEGLQYGMQNHDPRIVVYHNKFIVYWYNHATDENGPGARVLGKVGTFSSDMKNITWGGSETLVEIAPPPTLVRSRLWSNSPDIIDENFGIGAIRIMNGRLYGYGNIQARHGWVNDPQYSNTQSSPIPATNWSDSKTGGFIYDVGWNLGLRFYRTWKMCENTIIPATEMYCSSEQVTSIEVTHGRYKPVTPSIGIYQEMLPIAQASASFRNDVNNGTVTEFLRYPKYAAGTQSVAADGLNGLAHSTEFRRLDGKWVVIRDNLLNRGHYYSAIKDSVSDVYPPAYLTNLYGDAWANAGELPNGKCYIICNSMDRQEMFITISSDGINFDKTWLLLYAALKAHPGIGKTVAPSGPQYFKSVVVKDNLWIVYSIAKEQIGVTKVPISLLN